MACPYPVASGGWHFEAVALVEGNRGTEVAILFGRMRRYLTAASPVLIGRPALYRWMRVQPEPVEQKSPSQQSDQGYEVAVRWALMIFRSF